jgi:hypothetical protein
MMAFGTLWKASRCYGSLIISVSEFFKQNTPNSDCYVKFDSRFELLFNDSAEPW